MNTLQLALVAKQASHTGNKTTIGRLARSLGQAGGISTALFGTDEADALVAWSKEHPGGAVVGLHAFHTHVAVDSLARAHHSLPYILILGGTDVNEYLRAESKESQAARAVVVRVLRNACVIVSFNTHMAELVEAALHSDSPARSVPVSLSHGQTQAHPRVKEGSCPRIVVIPQAIELAVEEEKEEEEKEEGAFSIHEYAGVPPNHHVLLLCASLRVVKDPLFLVPAFQQWHASHEARARTHLVIIGAVLDSAIEAKVNALQPECGVHFVLPVAQRSLHAAMRQAAAVVNSSRSEGMCAAVLEGMLCGTPVLARDIPGNAALIDDERTGFLFDSPACFLGLVERITHPAHHEAVASVCAAAMEYARQAHSPRAERDAYVELFSQVLTPSITTSPPSTV
jgi:glycosyltransferase involved in cell wall biosynthesis